MQLLSFYGDPNIGLYAKACDKLVLLGRMMERWKQQLEKSLDVPCKLVSISETDFVGLFSAFNSNGIVLPKIIKEKELKEIASVFDNVLVLKGKYTAVGNLVLVNDRGGVVSKLITKKEKKMVEDALGVETVYGTIGGTDIVGSAAVANNKGCLLHRDASEDEAEVVASVLKVKVDIGTVNFGSPFVSSGVITNSHDVVVGDASSGPEIDRIIRTLGIQK